MTEKSCRYSISLFHPAVTVISSSSLSRPFFPLIFLFLFDIIVLVLLFSIRIEHGERENPGEACYSLFLSMNDKSTSSNNINNGIEEDENERRTSTTAITTTTTTTMMKKSFFRLFNQS